MMRRRFKFDPLSYLTIVMLLSGFSMLAQDNNVKAVVPASPTANSLGKYGEIPVSYHTGVPEISIPIHTVTEGELTLPISLNYHSSGIKVEEVASWVGLGWSLNAGGMISRTVVGSPDEGNSRQGGNSAAAGSGWYTVPGLAIGFIDNQCEANPNTTQAGFSLASSCLYHFMDAANGVADTEPDIFTFNFAGYSGKFFFDGKRRVVLQPQQDVQIIPGANFSSWTIVTPDGNIYTFGGPATENGYYGGGALGFGELSSTTWYLTQVQNAHKTRSINLSYVAEKSSYTVRGSQTIGADPNGAVVDSNLLYNNPGYAFLVSTNGVRLNQITTSSGFETISFNATTLRTDLSKYGFEGIANDEAKRLEAISVANSAWSKTFNFSYSYFTSPSGTSVPAFNGTLFDQTRLKLLSLQETSGAVTKPAHTFEYDMSYDQPRRLSLARDHWGYNNGAITNTGLVAGSGANFSLTIASFTYNNLANRNTDEAKMKAWILKKINYPTGGYSEFIYEAHRESASTIIGGLRVKQVKTSDGVQAQPRQKEFTYDYGRVYAGSPEYVQSTNNRDYSLAQVLVPAYMVSSSCRGAMKTTQGYHIGYSNVWVTEVGNGKTTYQYSNSTPGVDPKYPDSPSQYEIGTGDLLSEYHEDASGKLIYSIKNLYQTEFAGFVYAKKVVRLACITSCPANTGLLYSNEYALVRNYELRTGRRLLLSKVEYKDGATRVTKFEYSPRHNQPIKVTTVTGEDKLKEVTTDFSRDKYISTCTVNDSQCYQDYLQTLSSLRATLQSAITSCQASAEGHCIYSSNWIFLQDCMYGPDPKDWNWFTPMKSLERWLLGGCQNNCTLRKMDECISNGGYMTTYLNGAKQAQDTYTACRNLSLATYNTCVTNSLNSLNQTDKSLAFLITANLNVPLEGKVLVEGVQTEGSKTDYAFQSNLLQPTDFYTYDVSAAQWVKKTTTNYTNEGNVREVVNSDGVPITYLWGYNNTLPIAEVKNLSMPYIAANAALAGVQITANAGSCTNLNPSITVPFSQSPSFTVSFQGNTGMSVTLYLKSGGTTYFSKSYSPGTYNEQLSFNLSPGTYQYCYTATGYVSGYSALNVTMNLQDNVSRPLATHTSFETNGTTDANSKTGKKVWTGTYDLQLPGQIGTYTVTYWQRPAGGGSWTLQESTITTTSTTQNLTIGQLNYVIDEVRVHPPGAFMTTYTYEPGMGVTSVNDPNNFCAYYEYDALGRLILIRDADQNILKTIKYNYKN